MIYSQNTLIITYPNGNTTALIVNPTQQVLNQNRAKLQQKIINQFNTVEQCGFVFQHPENSEIIGRLEMFGKEFCGNATRSAVEVLKTESTKCGKIKVSGTNQMLSFWIQNNNNIKVTVPTPSNESVLIQSIDIGNIIMLEGIYHLVITNTNILSQVPEEASLFKQWSIKILHKYNLTSYSAAGCVLLYPNKSTRFGVWVRDIQTVFDETACGSGTCACGIVLASNSENKETSWNILQPSGQSILTGFDKQGTNKKNWWIEGSVSILFSNNMAILN